MGISWAAGVKTVYVSGWTGLKALDLPAGVKTVYVSDCTGLKTLDLPAGVKTVYARGCTGLPQWMQIDWYSSEAFNAKKRRHTA